jgi:hypothetical protein
MSRPKKSSQFAALTVLLTRWNFGDQATQPSKAAELFGRKVFVWESHPVDDVSRTHGRLLLPPYDKREPGLSDHLSGIVSCT